MRTKSILSIIVLTAVAMTASINDAGAAASVQVNTPGLNFSLSDFQPPPPNVYVYQNEGRPYYMERDHRVYMEKKHHGKKYKKEKKHHDDNGRGHGHDKH
jgi:hypothetical protein